MAKQPTPPIARIRAKLQFPNGPSGCWIFTGAKNSGYGYFTLRRGKNMLVHVFMYLEHGGTIAPHFELHHECETRACCNPNHLRVMPKVEHTMIGNAPPAMNARKTHCPKGHAYTLDNIYRTRGNVTWRICATCAKERARRRKAAKRNARAPRLTCNRGLHPWIRENWMQTRSGRVIKRCRLCSNENMKQRRARKRLTR